MEVVSSAPSRAEEGGGMLFLESESIPCLRRIEDVFVSVLEG